MSKRPFMRLWVGDFIKDTLELDAREIGAYMLLLMALWERGGTLPADQKKLKRVARCGREWPRVWATLEGYFTQESGHISNRKLSKELQFVYTKSQVNAQSGARGGRAKALKNNNAGLANATNSLDTDNRVQKSEKENKFSFLAEEDWSDDERRAAERWLARKLDRENGQGEVVSLSKRLAGGRKDD